MSRLPSFPRYLGFACLTVVLAVIGMWGSLYIYALAFEEEASFVTLLANIGFSFFPGVFFWGPILFTALLPGYWLFELLHIGVRRFSTDRFLPILLPAAAIACFSLWVPVVFSNSEFSVRYIIHEIRDSSFLLYFGIPASVLSAYLILIRREEI